MKLSVLALALSCLSSCAAERAILNLASESAAKPRHKARVAKVPGSNPTSIHDKAPELALPQWNVPLPRPSRVLQYALRRRWSSTPRALRSMRCWGRQLPLQRPRARPSQFHRTKPLQTAMLWRGPKRSRSPMPQRDCEPKLSRGIAKRTLLPQSSGWRARARLGLS
jgi:hypothetical protein